MTRAVDETTHVDELRLLEAEAVHIIREVVAELERPVLLFSAGKDSIVLLRLAEKAFRPLPLPFPVMHVDTGHNFPEVIEFRDRRVSDNGHKLIVASVQESIDQGRVWVSRPTADVRRRYTGRLAAGTLSVGDPVISLPARTRSTVTALDTLDDDRTTVVAPLSVSIELADDIDVGRGDVLVSGADEASLPVLARELHATVCWFVDSPLRAGDRLALKQTTRAFGPRCKSCIPGWTPRRSTS